jgi:hypothetical protein
MTVELARPRAGGNSALVEPKQEALALAARNCFGRASPWK